MNELIRELVEALQETRAVSRADAKDKAQQYRSKLVCAQLEIVNG